MKGNRFYFWMIPMDISVSLLWIADAVITLVENDPVPVGDYAGVCFCIALVFIASAFMNGLMYASSKNEQLLTEDDDEYCGEDDEE